MIAIPSLLLALACGGGGQREATPRESTAGAEMPAGDTSRERAEATGDFTDEEIREFANVYLQLSTLQEQGSARVQAGEDAQTVATELQPQVEQIFEGTSLTPQRYDQIAERADQDAELRRRIEAELERAQQEPA